MASEISQLIAFVKRECETCRLVEPVLARLALEHPHFTLYSQDDPRFPETVAGVLDDTELEHSFNHNIETVPTLIRFAGGLEVERTVGWQREAWEAISGLAALGAELPSPRPGCGAKNVEPGIAERLALKFGALRLEAREIELGGQEDVMEVPFERGWSDGLPVVPPTPERVYRMLQATQRAPQEVVGMIPPNLVACTVEKVAINAVLAGCRPDYFPVVLTAVAAACQDPFAMHGVLATTYPAGPLVLVSGPLAQQIGMNSGQNAFGQGNRANATIGRALQLVIRNVGGGRPGGVDRAALGTPAKYTFCFAEREDSGWTTLAEDRGFRREQSTVTLFAAAGIVPVTDQKSRTPESLVDTFAVSLRRVGHHKLAQAADALLVVCPEHREVFAAAGWSKADLATALDARLQIPVEALRPHVDGNAEGMPERFLADRDNLPKFRPGGLMIVQAGGTAGKFSAIIEGWLASGERGSQPVTLEIEP